jgi:carboxyl-terminal processing protease
VDGDKDVTLGGEDPESQLEPQQELQLEPQQESLEPQEFQEPQEPPKPQDSQELRGSQEPQQEPQAHSQPAGSQPTRNNVRLFKRLCVALSLLLLALIFFVLGNLSSYLGLVEIGQRLPITNPQTQPADQAQDEVSTRQLAARLEEVAAYLDGASLYRYTQGDLDTATTEAINSLLATSDDPYAVYYTPEEYAAYKKTSEGEYSGIGVVLSLIDEKVTVLQVYENSPAKEAGIRPGDVLLAVDGLRQDWKLEEATEKIRRPVGQKVTIIWQRGTEERHTELTIKEINIPTIITHLITSNGQQVGYIYLRRFTTHSASELGEAIRQLDGMGAQSFVLDLRGNPGGFLTQAVAVTSLFVPEGVVVQIEDRQGIRTEKVSGNTVTDKPLVLIINKGSASASELVAAALQDHGRALIVGEVSYGKGTVQDVNALSWGGALKYTIAHYMSPNGKALDKVGVQPDVVVEFPDKEGDTALEDVITGGQYRYRRGADPQLDAALDHVGTPGQES